MKRRLFAVAIVLLAITAIPMGAMASSSETSFSHTHHPTVNVKTNVPGVNISQYNPSKYIRVSDGTNVTINITAIAANGIAGTADATSNNTTTTIYVRENISGHTVKHAHLYYNGRVRSTHLEKHDNKTWYVWQTNIIHKTDFAIRSSSLPNHIGPNKNATPGVPFNKTVGIPSGPVSTNNSSSHADVRAGRSNINVSKTQSSSGKNIHFRVDSPTHNGTTVYIKYSVINQSLHTRPSNVVAYFDGNATQYSSINVNGTIWVAVNISHFSAHDLEFQAVAYATTAGNPNSITLFGYVIPQTYLIGAGVLALIALVGGYLYLRQGRQVHVIQP